MTTLELEELKTLNLEFFVSRQYGVAETWRRTTFLAEMISLLFISLSVMLCFTGA